MKCLWFGHHYSSWTYTTAEHWEFIADLEELIRVPGVHGRRTCQRCGKIQWDMPPHLLPTIPSPTESPYDG